MRFILFGALMNSAFGFLAAPNMVNLNSENGRELGEVIERGKNFVIYHNRMHDVRLKYAIDCASDDTGGMIITSVHPLILEKQMIEMAVGSKLLPLQDFMVSESTVVDIRFLRTPKLSFLLTDEEMTECIELKAQLRYAVMISRAKIVELDLNSVSNPIVTNQMVSLVDNLHKRGLAHGEILDASSFVFANYRIFFRDISHAIGRVSDRFESVKLNDLQMLWKLISGADHVDDSITTADEVRLAIDNLCTPHLPAIDLLNDTDEGGLVLGQPRGRPGPLELMYDVVGSPNVLVKYEMGSFTAGVRSRVFLNNIMFKEGIGLSHTQISAPLIIPDVLNQGSKKLGFKIDDEEVSLHRKDGSMVFYTVHNFTDPLVVRRSAFAREKPLADDESANAHKALQVCSTLAKRLEELNGRVGLIHGDIRPEKIWVVLQKNGTNAFKFAHSRKIRPLLIDDVAPFEDWVGLLKIYKYFVSLKSDEKNQAKLDKLISDGTRELEQASDISKYSVIANAVMWKFIHYMGFMDKAWSGKAAIETLSGYTEGISRAEEELSIIISTTISPYADGRPTTERR